ncbi:MAG: PstS family phosphate ABC transporter substrate-binding protein [Cyclobacteriaceae bacterium]|nr:PstS family phosphate ABC transporter substrate-binding protein [Cyclobacteriaceae bacterium]
MNSVRGLLLITVLLFSFSCGQKEANNASEKLSGDIRIDGSSTVYPITEAIAEEFRVKQPSINVTIGVSGTGGGFKKFCRGESDINDASRLIKESEVGACQEGGIKYVGLKVAYDGLAVLVNKENTWVDHFTVEELKKIWEPAAQGKITKWNQIRSTWPNTEFTLYGPGVASGTYDYFTEAIVGKSGSSRGDFTASEDDNVLVKGIAGDKNAIGFFGMAYYEENMEILKLAPVDNGKGAVSPSQETVMNGSYAPLSRPVFIYVSEEALKKPEVSEFVRFYLSNARSIATDVGYVALPEQESKSEIAKFEAFAKGQ